MLSIILLIISIIVLLLLIFSCIKAEIDILYKYHTKEERKEILKRWSQNNPSRF